MNGPTRMIVRAVLATKLSHVRQAVESYAQDRLDQGKGVARGYAIGAGLYAAAGLFLIAALFVGAVALFRWIELHYGPNIAFGSIGGGLVVLALLCVVMAVIAMRPPKANFVGLASRLRVAMRVNPKTSTEAAVTDSYAPRSGRDALTTARNMAADVLKASPRASSSTAAGSPIATRAGAAVAVGLLGWALARRYSRPAPPVRMPRPKP